ncbi:MAG: D-alanyl-D-alanine carboxypeptidase family protein [Peptococcales bacterium]|jgi:D-alanyl-D-alanine carboxypeptidase (penicillin-binding protein 5/6)
MLRKINLLTLLFFLFFIATTPLLAADEPQITAQAAVLIDADTGKLIYGKNHNEPRPPASTTKILTAILGIEKGNLDDVVDISPRAAQTGEASLNLIAGEKITLENLLYGALLKSGNDTCVAIAEHVAPTVEDFVKLMNLKAQLIGCNNSNFINTNGLPAKNHYSSAYDLALIARYALKNPTFAKIVATPLYTVAWEASGRKRTIKNTNQLLTSYYGASGVKTGTTDAAGHCLIASASRDNRNLIAVVLKSHNRFNDARILLDYGFDNYRNINLIEENRKIIVPDTITNRAIALYTGNNLQVTIDTREKVDITRELVLDWIKLRKKDDKDVLVGRIKYFNNNVEIGSVPLYLAEELETYEKPFFPFGIWQEIKGIIKKTRIINN